MILQLPAFIAVALLACSTSFGIKVAPKQYSCQGGKCIQLSPFIKNSSTSVNGRKVSSQSTCLLTCGGSGNLWPRPNGHLVMGEGQVLPVSTILPFKPASQDDKGLPKRLKNLIKQAEILFHQDLESLKPESYGKGSAALAAATLFWPKSSSGSKSPSAFSPQDSAALKVHVSLIISDPKVVAPSTTVDESYSLTISSSSKHRQGRRISVIISAETFFGARHGIETLGQLFSWEKDGLVIASNVTLIGDGPKFPHRGVMMDLARHFLSVNTIRSTIRPENHYHQID